MPLSQKTIKLLIGPRNLVSLFRQILFLTQYKQRQLQHSLLFFSHIARTQEHYEIIRMIQIMLVTAVQSGAFLIPGLEVPNYILN